jgi:branched-chain amino acid transport system substrate-binding protein
MTANVRRGALAAVLALAGTLGGSPAARAETFTIGVHGDWARATSYYSLFQRDVINAYFDILNQKGGIDGTKINLLWEDDEATPTVAVTKAEKLVALGACVVFSIGGSGTGIAVQAKLEQMKIPHGSAANSLDALTNPVKRYYFRMAPKGSSEADAVIKFMKIKYGSPKMVIINDNTRTSLLIADEWVKALNSAGLETISHIQFEAGAADLSPHVLKIRELKPGAILLTGTVPDTANFLKSYKRLGLTIPVQGTYVMTAGSFSDLAGTAADGLVITDAIDPDRPEVKAIDAVVVPRLGERARSQGLAVMAWELSRVFTEATRRAGGKCDREVIRDAIESTRNFPTALGPEGTTINFSPTNHDVFVSGDQVVMRMFEKGRLGRAVK